MSTRNASSCYRLLSRISHALSEKIGNDGLTFKRRLQILYAIFPPLLGINFKWYLQLILRYPVNNSQYQQTYYFT